MAASNLFGYYSGQGQAMPSLSARGQLYQQYGLGQSTDYSGTAAQNTALLNALQGGGGSLGLGSSTASTPATSSNQSFGSYQPVIDTLTQQEQGLSGIYQPQVTALQASLPTIQQKYSDMLSELSRETGVEQGNLQSGQTSAVSSAKAQAAAAGVAESEGSPQAAVQAAIKKQYSDAITNLLAQSASGAQQLGTEQAQETQGVNQSIASLLGQQSTAQSNIAAQIAQTQAQYAAQQEQAREFNAQLSAQEAETASTDESNALLSQELGGKNAISTPTSSGGFNFFSSTGQPISAADYLQATTGSVTLDGLKTILSKSSDQNDITALEVINRGGTLQQLQTYFPNLFPK